MHIFGVNLKMAIMWPQESFFCPEEDMMVYSTHKYYETKLCTQKLDIQANISKKKGTQKTSSYLTALNKKKEEVTSLATW